MVRVLRALLQSNGWLNITDVPSGREALEQVTGAEIVLLDQQLPDTTGIDLLPLLLARGNPPSIIMVTGEGSEELAATALRLGAEDYVVKGSRLKELLPATVERARRNRMLKATKAEVERELVRVERVAAIGEMTVTLHHEINNPLMAALAETDLLLEGPAREPQVRAGLEEIRAALIRIRDIIKQAGALRRADSAEYLSGLRMIDLASATSGVAQARGRAVLAAPDDELARATALLLRHAGFSVDRVATAAEAERESGRLDTTLVVLTAVGMSAGPLQGFRPPLDRWFSLVVLVPGDPEPARAAGADLVFTLPFDPTTFSSEILRVMEGEE